MGAPIRPGDVIDGTYVVERLLGHGAMGAVFAARDERLGRRVALKLLLPARGENPEALARFEREARSSAALQSDHAVRVYGVGRTADGAPYIAMELLEGEDLAALLARRGPLPASDVVAILLQVCEAVSEAHALGIVHRDLKPANLFLARRPSGATTVKVLDFGLSKARADEAGVPLTAAQASMGTPLYMSPEQVRDVRTADGRADVWALGAVMYALLTGRPPFLGASVPEVYQAILERAAQPLSRVRPDVPPALEAIVLRCLEKAPAQRFASVRGLAEALSALSAAAARPSGAALAAPRMSEPRMVSPQAATLGGPPLPIAAAAPKLDPSAATALAPTVAMTAPELPPTPALPVTLDATGPNGPPLRPLPPLPPPAVSPTLDMAVSQTLTPPPMNRTAPWLVGALVVALSLGAIYLVFRRPAELAPPHAGADAGVSSQASAGSAGLSPPRVSTEPPGLPSVAAPSPRSPLGSPTGPRVVGPATPPGRPPALPASVSPPPEPGQPVPAPSPAPTPGSLMPNSRI